MPWGTELFSRDGVLPAANLNPTYALFPNILSSADSPQLVTAFLAAMIVLAFLFAAGVVRHVAAVLLWYGWACLFNRNVLISNPSIPYVGFLLLLTTLIPAREDLRLLGRQRSDFYVPGGVYWSAWTLMALGYSFSGFVKFQSPSWVDGTAMIHVLNNPLARDGIFRNIALRLPVGILRFSSWSVLFLEASFAFFALWRRMRPLIWLALVVLHLGIVLLVSFADLSVGMLRSISSPSTPTGWTSAP